MALHARQIAVAAGADDGEVERLARQLIVDQQITLTHARFLLADQRKVEKER